jgi:hypothetical protein
MQLRFGSSGTVRKIFPVRVLVVVAFFIFRPSIFTPTSRVFAADIELYECKDAKMADIVKDIGSPGIHNVYKFDFVNNSVSNRLLDDDGKDYEAIGVSVGQTQKYTAEFILDGDIAKWTHVVQSDPSGSVTENATFNVKTHEMHQILVITPKPGAAGVPADAKPESIESDLTCTIYLPKKHDS